MGNGTPAYKPQINQLYSDGRPSAIPSETSAKDAAAEAAAENATRIRKTNRTVEKQVQGMIRSPDPKIKLAGMRQWAELNATPGFVSSYGHIPTDGEYDQQDYSSGQERIELGMQAKRKPAAESGQQGADEIARGAANFSQPKGANGNPQAPVPTTNADGLVSAPEYTPAPNGPAGATTPPAPAAPSANGKPAARGSFAEQEEAARARSTASGAFGEGGSYFSTPSQKTGSQTKGDFDQTLADKKLNDVLSNYPKATQEMFLKMPAQDRARMVGELEAKKALREIESLVAGPIFDSAERKQLYQVVKNNSKKEEDVQLREEEAKAKIRVNSNEEQASAQEFLDSLGGFDSADFAAPTSMTPSKTESTATQPSPTPPPDTSRTSVSSVKDNGKGFFRSLASDIGQGINRLGAYAKESGEASVRSSASTSLKQLRKLDSAIEGSTSKKQGATSQTGIALRRNEITARKQDAMQARQKILVQYLNGDPVAKKVVEEDPQLQRMIKEREAEQAATTAAINQSRQRRDRAIGDAEWFASSLT